MSLSATTSRNPVDTVTTDGQIVFPLKSADAVNLGDLVVWDHTNGTVRTPTNQSDMSLSSGGYCGVALQTNPVTSAIDAVNNVCTMLVARLGTFLFFGTSGDSFTTFAPVFFNENGSVQTVTVSTNSGARTQQVGLFMPTNTQLVANASGSSFAYTGVTGAYVRVWLTPLFPTLSGV